MLGKLRPRINPPPKIQSVKPFNRTVFKIGNRPHIVYAVVDSFCLQVKEHALQTMLTIPADAGILSIPGVEPIVCFLPIPGRGRYDIGPIRPSILFWRNKFWVPVYGINPIRTEIAEHMYGSGVFQKFMFDIIAMTDVSDIPDVDLLDFNTADTSWVPLG